MSEQLGKGEARSKNFRTFVTYAGKFIRGEAVVVPVSRENYGSLQGNPLAVDMTERSGEELNRTPNDLATRWRSMSRSIAIGLSSSFDRIVGVASSIIEPPDTNMGMGKGAPEKAVQVQADAGEDVT